MEAKKKRTIIVSMLALSGLLGALAFAIAGDSATETTPPPHQIVEAPPTRKTKRIQILIFMSYAPDKNNNAQQKYEN